MHGPVSLLALIIICILALLLGVFGTVIYFIYRAIRCFFDRR